MSIYLITFFSYFHTLLFLMMTFKCLNITKRKCIMSNIIIIILTKVNKCLNITSEETGACVLVRAARPLKGIEVFVVILIAIVIVIAIVIIEMQFFKDNV